MQVVERSSVLALFLAITTLVAAKWIGARAEGQRCLSSVRAVPNVPRGADWTVHREHGGRRVTAGDLAFECNDDAIPLLTPKTDAARALLPGRPAPR